MTKQTQEQEREPLLTIVRSKVIHKYGNGGRERISRREFDAFGRVKLRHEIGAWLEWPNVLSNRKISCDVTTYVEYSPDGKIRTERNVGSIDGFPRYTKDNNERRIFLDSQGRVMEEQYFWLKDGALVLGYTDRYSFDMNSETKTTGSNEKTHNQITWRFDERKNVIEIIRRDMHGLLKSGCESTRSFQYAYDSQGRVIKVIHSEEDKPKTIQTIEYLEGGSTLTKVSPFSENISLNAFHIYRNNPHQPIDFFVPSTDFRDKRFTGVNYLETRIERKGTDKDGLPYEATLTRGWFESVSTEKKVEDPILLEMRLRK